MGEAIHPPGEAEKPGMDPGLLAREFESFREILAGTMTAKSLKLWVGKDAGRKAITADTLWGTIRWPRAFGLPRTLILSGAFIVEHRLWETRSTNDQISKIEYDLRIPNGPPQKWDGPHDEQYYRVSFMSYTTGGDKSEILVDFAKGMTWASEGRPALSVQRRISPTSIAYTHLKDNKAFVLPPFTVINRRLFG